MQNPLLWLACCFALGIVSAPVSRSGHFLDLNATRNIPLALGASGLSTLAGLVALRKQWQRTATGLALAGFIFAGAAAALLFEFRFPPDHVSRLAESRLRDPVLVEGRVASTPLRTGLGLQFDMELTSLRKGARKDTGSGREAATHEATSEGTSPSRFTPGPSTRKRSSAPLGHEGSFVAPMSDSGRIRLRLEAGDAASGASWATIESLQLKHGDDLRTFVRLRRPRVYQNPGSFDFRRWMESIEDVYLVGTIEDASQVEKLDAPPAGDAPQDLWQGILSAMTRGIAGARQRMLEAIDVIYPPWLPEGRYGSVVKAVLLGDRSSVDSDTLESFRKAGLYHLLVIAGLHIGLLAMLATAGLRWLGLGSTARSVAVLLFLLGYGVLVEQRAPTLRATLMISIFLVARLLYRRRSLLNAVGLAALVLLLARPAWLFESGFQLSFAAALLIAGLAVPIIDHTTEPYRRGLRRLDVVELDFSLEPRIAQFRLDLRSLVKWLRSRFRLLARYPRTASWLVVAPAQAAIWTANILLFSAILQTGLLLPMAETFHRVTYAGIGLNAIAIPLMTVLLAVAVPTVLLAAFSPAIASVPASLLAMMMSALFALARLPHLPAWLSYRVPEPPGWVAWGFAASAVAAGCAFSASKKPDDDESTAPGLHPLLFWPSLGLLGVFAALVSTYPFPPRVPAGELEVTALDCDGGNALFVVLPGGHTLLVGAGGGRSVGGRENAFQRRWDPGEDIVSPYLWSRGVKSIDALVVADTREDQLEGFAAVMRNFRVGELWRAAYGGASVSYGPLYSEVFDEVYRQRIRVRELATGNSIAWGKASARVLWPPSACEGGYDSDPSAIPRPDRRGGAPGDDSLALRISAGRASLLLPEEMSGPVEKRLARSGLTLASDLLEVGRHGAKASSTDEFLALVAPQIAIITAAGASTRSSPNPETLDRLRKVGARVFRTDLDGAITVAWQADGASPPVVRCYGRSKAR